MRLVFDYTPAINQGAGIGRYVRAAGLALLKIDRENEYTFFYASEGKASEPLILEELLAAGKEHPHFRLCRSPLGNHTLTILWHRLHVPGSLLPVERFTGPFDVFHATDFLAPPQRHGCSVVTVHDLSFLTVPEAATESLRKFLKVNVPRSLRRAAKIIAVSDFTRGELIRLLGVEESKIIVAPNGVDQRFRGIITEEERQKARSVLHLPSRFILHVGTIEPRKNLLNLIEAYARLRKEGITESKLVLAGRKGWLYEPLFQRIEALGLSDEVIFPGYVPDELLPALYSSAEVFAYPSLYEGFGLPVAEALACGAIVLTSNTSAFPEVAGEAALLVEPRDPGEIAKGLTRLLTDKDLRLRLSLAGPEQVAPFTWERAAQKMLEAYSSVLI